MKRYQKQQSEHRFKLSEQYRCSLNNGDYKVLYISAQFVT